MLFSVLQIHLTYHTYPLAKTNGYVVSQHFLLSTKARTVRLADVFAMADEKVEDDILPTSVGRVLTASRCAHTAASTGCLHRPPSEWFAPFPLPDQGMPKGFHPDQRHAIRQPQEAAAHLPGGYRDVCKRSEGQERAGAVARPRHVLQGRVRAAAQAARSDGRGNEGPHHR